MRFVIVFRIDDARAITLFHGGASHPPSSQPLISFDTKVHEDTDPMKSTRRVPHRKGTDGVFRADACFPIYIHTLRVLARCLLLQRDNKSAPGHLTSLLAYASRVSSGDISILLDGRNEYRARDARHSALAYIGMRIGWRAGTQDAAPGPRRIICMPVLTDSHGGCCAYLWNVALPYGHPWMLHAYRVCRKLIREMINNEVAKR